MKNKHDRGNEARRTFDRFRYPKTPIEHKRFNQAFNRWVKSIGFPDAQIPTPRLTKQIV